jgi:hypothetical protein
MFGWTDNYVRVEVPLNDAFINKVVDVRLDKVNDNMHVEGVIV